jgi:hypothetical protein
VRLRESDLTERSAARILSRRAIEVIRWCEALETTKPQPIEAGCEIVRGDSDCQHQGGREPESDGLANRGELRINVVMLGGLKMLTSPNQNGKWSGLSSSGTSSIVLTGQILFEIFRLP